MTTLTYVPERVGEGFFTDVPIPGSGDDDKALTWDNGTGKFVYAAFDPAGTAATAVAAHVAASDPHSGYLLLAGRSGGQTFSGGTGTTDSLVLRATSGVGATGSKIRMLVGNNGATEALTILNDGRIGVGTIEPNSVFEIRKDASVLTPILRLTCRSSSGAPVGAIGFDATAGAETQSMKAGIGLLRNNSNGRGFLQFFNRATSDTNDFTATDLIAQITTLGLHIGTNVAPNNGFRDLTVRTRGSATPFLLINGGSSNGIIEIWRDEAGAGGVPTKAVAFGMSPTGSITDNLYLSTFDGASWSGRLFIENSTGNIGAYTATPTARLDIAASTTAGASLRIREAGARPTTPNSGDFWNNGAIGSYQINATTNAVVNSLILERASSGTPAAGFGLGIAARLESSTTEDQDAGRLAWEWVTATHASRASRGKLSAYYTSTEQEAMRWDGDTGGLKLAFYGQAAVARQTLATGAGATVDDVITALQALGLVKQS